VIGSGVKGSLVVATTSTETPIDADREREITESRAEVLRRAEAQGVKPFRSLEDLKGDPEMVDDFDVDEFLRQVHEDRDRPSTRSVE
jgi:hypothetical protein